jgi:hypothetical protein
LVKEKYEFNAIDKHNEIYSWILFALVPVVLTALTFKIAQFLPLDSLKGSSVTEIELANNSFLPTYLGYFFVSLGVNEVHTLVFVFSIIYIFTFLSQTLYFNPIFLLFGYHFYFVKTTGNLKIFLITRRILKSPGFDSFDGLRRINNYTFIDLKN